MTLTERERAMLALLTQDEVDDYPPEVCCSGGQAWVGTEQFSMATVRGLLRLLALRDTSDVKGADRFEINETGRALLAGTITPDDVVAALASGLPFTMKDGKIAALKVPSGVHKS